MNTCTLINTGHCTLNDVESMQNEIIKMMEFNHPHVLSLIGVCLDHEYGVSMVMPHMINGSLLDYLKKEQCNLVAQDLDPDKVGCVTIELERQLSNNY